MIDALMVTVGAVVALATSTHALWGLCRAHTPSTPVLLHVAGRSLVPPDLHD